MRSRDSKGRFTKKDSDKSEKKTKGIGSAYSAKGTKYKDSRGRWHGKNGKYV